MAENTIKKKWDEIYSESYETFKARRNKSYEYLETDFTFFLFYCKKLKL
jgi:hypothetical protein